MTDRGGADKRVRARATRGRASATSRRRGRDDVSQEEDQQQQQQQRQQQVDADTTPVQGQPEVPPPDPVASTALPASPSSPKRSRPSPVRSPGARSSSFASPVSPLVRSRGFPGAPTASLATPGAGGASAAQQLHQAAAVSGHPIGAAQPRLTRSAGPIGRTRGRTSRRRSKMGASMGMGDSPMGPGTGGGSRLGAACDASAYHHHHHLLLHGEAEAAPAASLYQWGEGSMGQLATTGFRSAAAPQPVADSFGGGIVRSLALGANHSVLLTQDGHLFSWGSNVQGQCGRLYGVQDVIQWPAAVQWSTSVALAVRSEARAEPAPQEGSRALLDVSPKVRLIAAGMDHTVAVLDNDMVVAWGANQYLQCGGWTVAEEQQTLQEAGAAGGAPSGRGSRRRRRRKGKPKREEEEEEEEVGGDGDTSASQRDGDATDASSGKKEAEDEDDVGTTTSGTRSRTCSSKASRVQSIDARNQSSKPIVAQPTLVAMAHKASKDAPVAQPVYRLSSLIPGDRVAAVACGGRHSACVMRSGALLCWGDNAEGQLGRGNRNHAISGHPEVVTALWAVSVLSVSCGDAHTIVIAVDGSAWSFGRNRHGQLGRTSADYIGSAWTPNMVGVPRACGAANGKRDVDDGDDDGHEKQRQLTRVGWSSAACGSNHTLLLSSHGRVFGCGDHLSGQVIREDSLSSSTSSASVRWQLHQMRSFPNVSTSSPSSSASHVSNGASSMRSDALGGPPTIVQVACCADASAALTERGDLFMWGNGTRGQCASADRRVHRVPLHVSGHRFSRVVCGAHHVIASTLSATATASTNSSSSTTLLPLDKPIPFRFSPSDLRKSLSLNNDATSWKRIAAVVRRMFASLRSLSVAFRSSANGGIDWQSVEDTYASLLACKSELIQTTLSTSIQRLLLSASRAMFAHDTGDKNKSSKSSSYTCPSTSVRAHAQLQRSDVEGLVVLWRCPLFWNATATMTTTAVSASAQSHAQSSPLLLVQLCRLMWWVCDDDSHDDDDDDDDADEPHLRKTTKLLINVFEKASNSSAQYIASLRTQVRLLHAFLNEVLRRERKATSLVWYCMCVLAVLHRLNERMRLIEYQEFHNLVISDHINVEVDFLRYVDGLDAFCGFAFVLTPLAKSRAIQFESLLSQDSQANRAVIRRFFRGARERPEFVVTVRREYIVADAVHAFAKVEDTSQFKKRLKVKFAGEEGVDEGGVRKEFFMLLMRELLCVSYGMFDYNEETRTFWFSKVSFENDFEFRLVGIMLGVGIYNNIILDVKFPLFVYKKLLNADIEVTDEDFAEVFPSIYRSLQQMLQYEGDDMEDVFCIDFSVQYDAFGRTVSHDLIENGSEVMVTQETKHMYYERYRQFLLVDSVSAQMSAFIQGFQLVCDGDMLSMCRPEELEVLIVGDPHIDFQLLREHTEYTGGYDSHSDTVEHFWSIVADDMDDTQQQQLLMFCTGCDRAPVGGLAELSFVVQRAGPDSDRLPTAHTCFNTLLLPDYGDRDKLLRLLLIAIANSEGFGLM